MVDNKYLKKNTIIINNFEKKILDVSYDDFINNASDLTNLPKDIIKKKVNQFLSRKFSFKNKKINKEKNFVLFILSNIKYLFFTVVLLFISKIFYFKKSSFQTDVLVDHVANEHDLDLYRNLIKKKKIIFLTKKNFVPFKNYNKVFLKKKKIPFLHNLFDIKKTLNCAVLYFFISIKNNEPFLKYLFYIIYSYSRNLSYFRYISSKYLIFHRIYWSCPIRKHLFKNICGGTNVFTIQTHIIEDSFSLFTDVDFLLTFNKSIDTKNKLIYLGGSVNKFKSIGSLRMEHELKNLHINKKFQKKIDILIIGINPTSGWMMTSKKVKKNYYVFLKWMVKISNEFPKLKFVYKHHNSFTKDDIEDKILKKSKIEKIIQDKDKFSTYHYLVNSPLSFSFGSTMIIEGKLINKECYFIDPKFENTTFFSKLPDLAKLRVASYETLKKIIVKNFANKKIKKKFNLSYNQVTKNLDKILK